VTLVRSFEENSVEGGFKVHRALRLRFYTSDFSDAPHGISTASQFQIVPYALVFTFWALAALQWPLHDMVVPWDSKNQFYAFFRFMAASIHQGSTPFWNPYHYAGHPSIADPQSLIFSPAFILWALVEPAPSLFAFDLMVFAHLLIGGFAIVQYGRRRAWTTSGTVLAAMIFMLGGTVSGRLSHVGIIIAYGLFPVALLWLEIVLERRAILAAAGLGFVTALIILGRTQVPLLMCGVIGFMLFARVTEQPRPIMYFLSRLPVLVLSGVVTLLLISVPMLLTLQFADFSNRPEIDLELALKSSLYPLNFANFFAANIFGSLEPLRSGNWGPSYFTRPDVDGTDRAFNYLFIGSLPALLLVWHGIGGGRAFMRETRWLTAIAIFATLYAFGRYTPLFPFLFDHVAGIDLFRRPVDAMFIFIMALAFFSGHLATEYVRRGFPRCPPGVIVTVTAAIAALLIWALTFSSFSSNGWKAAIELAKVLPIYAGLIVLLTRQNTQSARAFAFSLAVAFTGGELIFRNAATPLNGEPRAYYTMLEAPGKEATAIIDAIKVDMREHSQPGVRPRIEVVGLGGPWQNAAMVYGLEATNGYNPLRIGPYDRLVSPGEDTYTPLHRLFPTSFPGYDCALGQVLGLQYVVLDRPIEKLPNRNRQTVAELIMAGPSTWIYRLGSVTPRVTLENRVLVANAEEVIDSGRFPRVAPESDILVDADDDLSQKYPNSGAAAPGSAKIVKWAPDRTEITVETSAPAILTLHDPWYPGWEVEVDGQPRTILRTDLLFRGVEVPMGTHRVVFAYRPLSLNNLSEAAKLVFSDDD
jgi:hypothetical protein